MAKNELKVFATEARMEQRDRAITSRIKAIRAAVEMIVDNSVDWSCEVQGAFAELPKEERAAFAHDAGRAVGELGDFIASAAGGLRQ